jgi:transcriptional regulator with XRE-family HTH domain
MLQLRRVRQEKNLTLRELETRTGIANGDLSLIERGLKPSWPGWRKRIALVLGVSEDVLFSSVEPEISEVGDSE